MKITYFNISGWDGAMRSFFMSNKRYSKEIEEKLRNVEKFLALREYGIIKEDATCDDLFWYEKIKKNLIETGKKHTTLLRFIDITFVVDGLHRGAQDDFDSHAKRLESRIVRMSTRVRNNEKLNEVSDFYKGKIITFDELTKQFDLPDEFIKDDKKFVRTPFGYVQDEYKEDRDVLRGNIPLAVSSMFTVKVNLTELCHIVRERAPGSAAAPELQEMIRMLVEDYIYPELGLDIEWLKNNCYQ